MLALRRFTYSHACHHVVSFEMRILLSSIPTTERRAFNRMPLFNIIFEPSHLHQTFQAPSPDHGHRAILTPGTESIVRYRALSSIDVCSRDIA